MIRKLIYKMRKRRFCKLNRWFCPDCIYHDFVFEGAIFRGNRCRYPIQRKERGMKKVILRLKSGREFVFECESYSLRTLSLNGSLCDFNYKGGIGECPIWFSLEDVEAIVVVRKGGD